MNQPLFKTKCYLIIILGLLSLSPVCAQSSNFSKQILTLLEAGEVNKATKILADYLGQNGKFEINNFDANISFNNPIFWLGLKNFESGDYTRASLAFILFNYISDMREPDAEKYGHLAQGNCFLAAAMQESYQYDNALSQYKLSSKKNVANAISGELIVHTFRRDLDSAKYLVNDESNFKLLTNSVLLCYALTFNDKDLFKDCIKKIKLNDLKSDICFAHNVLVGIKRYEIINDELIKACENTDTPDRMAAMRRAPGVIYLLPLGVKNPLDSSLEERKQTLYIDIEKSIGWANERTKMGSD